MGVAEISGRSERYLSPCCEFSCYSAADMKAYRTIAQRKRDEADRRALAARSISEHLRGYLRERPDRGDARSKGGRFLLYGSLARGETRFDSDIDLLLDFPADIEAEAWRFAEEICADHGIEADIKPLAWCTTQFAAQITRYAVVLG